MTADTANQQMVDQLIARGALWSRPLIEAFRTTPRHRFLDRVYHFHRRHGWREVHTREPGRGEVRLLYSDRALTTRLSDPLPGQSAVAISSSSQPSLMAEILEDLLLARGLRTLEIGAGTGYNAALLARVVGPVVSVEVDRRVLAEARAHLHAFPDRCVELRHGDGRLGWPPGAPYDRILVTAATPDLEPAWLEQLAEEGVLLAPLDLAPGLAYLVRGSVRGGEFEGHLTRPAYFMPLRNEAESGRGGGDAGPLLASPDPLPAVRAPWADWLERRVSFTGPGLLPSLAFLGFLHGYRIAYQALADGRTVYGVADLVHGHACWLGSREWRTTGAAGRDLGLRLWHSFLDAGGPWPTEFTLRAVPLRDGSPPVQPSPISEGLVFRRQGPRCLQIWTLPETRRRFG
jgi:protein-L-isoaspartate(D-aspartate) O-methyltransferase